MTDDTAERVSRLLADAGERVDSLDHDDASDGDVTDAFADLSREANDLVSEAEPVELLDAVGATDVSEDDPPETLSKALGRSDPDTVVALRKLLVLSRIADDTDDSDPTTQLETLRELYDSGEEGDETDASDEGEAAGEDTEDEDDATGSTETSTDGSDTSDSGDSAGDVEGDDDGVAEQLRETLLGGVDEFRDGVQEVRADLEAGDEGEDETAEESGTDESSRGAGSDGTMLSTVPSRGRTDLRSSTRFSTVRERNDG